MYLNKEVVLREREALRPLHNKRLLCLVSRRGGYPSPSWKGSTPVLFWLGGRGIPQSCSGKGVPQLCSGWEIPLSWGTPPPAGVPPGQDWRTPPPARTGVPPPPPWKGPGKEPGTEITPPPQMWTDRHLWKQYLPHPSDAGVSCLLKWKGWSTVGFVASSSTTKNIAELVVRLNKCELQQLAQPHDCISRRIFTLN